MSYMNCPRCGLSIRVRASFLSLDCCPRCVARAGVVIPMLASDDRASTPAVVAAESAAVGRVVEPVAPSALVGTSLNDESQRSAVPVAPAAAPESTIEAAQPDGLQSLPPARVTPSGPLSAGGEQV
jgi:hypothetical protein